MKFFNFTKGYFRGVLGELKKVTWPRKNEAINYIIIVIASLVVSIICVIFIDQFLNFFVDNILGING